MQTRFDPSPIARTAAATANRYRLRSRTSDDEMAMRLLAAAHAHEHWACFPYSPNAKAEALRAANEVLVEEYVRIGRIPRR